jgi:group I intron endonuclease
MNIYTIYKATNIINDKVYIGFTSYTTEERTAAHLNNSKRIKNKFYNAIKKYGWTNFKWETIYQSLDYEHTLGVMENHFIVEHNSFKHGYNSTLGGDGVVGRKDTSEQIQRKKDSANKVYKNMSVQERKEKFGKFGSENSFYNKSHSDEDIQKMKESHAKQRKMLMLCENCDKEVDAQNYALHHGRKCGIGSAVRGRKWYHSDDMISYYLLPSDDKVKELNLILGRVTKKKLGRPKIK